MNTSDSVQTVYELPLLPNNTAVKYFYTNRSGAKFWLDIYRWVNGLAMTGRIRDNGQNVSQSVFETENSSSQQPLLLPHRIPYRISGQGLC